MRWESHLHSRKCALSLLKKESLDWAIFILSSTFSFGENHWGNAWATEGPEIMGPFSVRLGIDDTVSVFSGSSWWWSEKRVQNKMYFFLLLHLKCCTILQNWQNWMEICCFLFFLNKIQQLTSLLNSSPTIRKAKQISLLDPNVIELQRATGIELYCIY